MHVAVAMVLLRRPGSADATCLQTHSLRGRARALRLSEKASQCPVARRCRTTRGRSCDSHPRAHQRRSLAAQCAAVHDLCGTNRATHIV